MNSAGEQIAGERQCSTTALRSPVIRSDLDATRANYYALTSEDAATGESKSCEAAQVALSHPVEDRLVLRVHLQLRLLA